MEMADQLGDRLAHIHLADGSGSTRDEHLVPGRGQQPCAELLHEMARREFDGQVVVEISTRRADSRDQREADLVESLDFARRHLVWPPPTDDPDSTATEHAPPAASEGGWLR